MEVDIVDMRKEMKEEDMNNSLVGLALHLLLGDLSVGLGGIRL